MISIIIPVYKAELTICRCIDSIYNQDYQDWEILLIDDGSPDNSGEICDEYAAKDNRIRVIHKPNGGVSSARNCGLDNSNGDWICFIDADDYIKGNYFGCVTNCNEDIILQGSNSFCEEGGNAPQDMKIPRMIVKGNLFLRSFLSHYSHTQKIRTPWSKLFRKSIIGDIRFNEQMRIGEDTNFVFRVMLNNPSIYIANSGIYQYFVSSVDDREKYAISYNKFVYSLHQLFDIYDAIGARNILLENSMYIFFSKICIEHRHDKLQILGKDALIQRLGFTSRIFAVKIFNVLLTRLILPIKRKFSPLMIISRIRF